MGQRSEFASMAVILTAFAEKRRWSQADLARRAALTVPALKRRLVELQTAGIPFDVSDDRPHKVWSVPEGWFPGAVLFDAKQSAELLRVLVQAPRSAGRDKLIARVSGGLPRGEPARDLSRAMEVPALDPIEERALTTLQRCVGNTVVRMHWYSEKRREMEWREMSPQQIVMNPSPRAVGYCHRDSALKYFKAVNMTHVEPREAGIFHPVAKDRVDTFIHDSIDGFHGDAVEQCIFVVREQEWRWLRAQIGVHEVSAENEAEPGWRRVELRTSAVLILARQLVGIGDAVRAESPGLVGRMRILVGGSVHALGHGT